MTLWETILEAILRWLAAALEKLRPPAKPSISATFLRYEGKMLVYRLNLDPNPGTVPVAFSTVFETVNSGPARSFSAHDGDEVSYSADDNVTLVRQDTSVHGVTSPLSDTFSFVAADQSPPAQPNAPSVTFLRTE